MNRMTKNICEAVAKVVGLLSIFLVWAGSTSAQSADFSLHRIGDDVWAAIVTDAGKAGGNAGFVVGDEGIAVIDTFEDPGAARELLAAIGEISTLPIRFVINTHYHLDHVNGNDGFANAGAMVVAHRNLRAWMHTENLKWWGDAIKPSDKARVQSLKLPDVTYDDRIDLYLGKDCSQLVFSRAAAPGLSLRHPGCPHVRSDCEHQREDIHAALTGRRQAPCPVPYHPARESKSGNRSFAPQLRLD
jgi:Metallo-beta-lactamase superfamily